MIQTQSHSKEFTFFDQLSALYDKVSMDALSNFRAEAWQRFLSLGLPSKGEESFQYVPLKQFYDTLHFRTDHTEISMLLEEDVKNLILPECKGSALVFVDGKLNLSLSRLQGISSQVSILPMEEALKSSYNLFLRHRMHGQIQKETDPFACLNGALFPQGVFIYIPPKVELSAPIQCIHVLSSPDMSLLVPRIHLFLGARSRLEWISSTMLNEGYGVFYNGVLDVALEEGASFKQFSHAFGSGLAWGFENVKATLKKDSRFSSHMTCFGGGSYRHAYHTALLGEGAEVDLQGISLLDGKKQSHVHVLVDHAAPYCQSQQLFKMVLSDQARSSFSGKIYVREQAQKTQAYQLNNNLLLSDIAIANSKPGLEIFADDVKASHGATFSQIGEEEIFYLRARGLSTEMAKALLTFGFCKDLLDRIPYPILHEKLIEKTHLFLNQYK